MKKTKFLPIFLIVCIFISILVPMGVFAVEPPENTAKSALVIDRESGNVIYAKNADSVLAPASTTKIMTALLAVEAIERGELTLSEEVTAQASMVYDLISDGSSAGIAVGETMTMENLLYCTMLASANEACNIIAQRVSGNIPDFIALMNQRAKELGCYTTRFMNTHGLPDVNHYTTAYDLAQISLEAAKHPLFMTFCGTAEKTIPATNMNPERELANSNALLSAKSMYGSGYVYDGTSGMKTGHTSAAGYCLVSTAEKNGIKLLCLVFGEGSSDASFSDSAKLLDWAFTNPSANIVINTDSLLADSSKATPPAVLLAVGDTEVPPVTSAAAIVLDRVSGEVFYTKSPEAAVYPADLTKIMTALIVADAVEDGSVSLDATVPVSQAAVSSVSNGGTVMLQPGDTYSLENLLYFAMLASADDACNAMAEYISGSIPSFVELMNRKASELGCTNTHFANTHGAYTPDHYTTASDFSLIAMEASHSALFMKICNTVSAEIPAAEHSAARTLISTNALICDQSVYGKNYIYERASGMKTGYNTSAGYCLASCADDDETGIKLLTLVFGGVKKGTDYSCFTDSIDLYDWVLNNYSYQEVLKATENIASVDIALGSDADYVNLHPASSIFVLLPNNYDPNDVQIDMVVYSLLEGKKLTAPISNGEVLGEVTVTHNGRTYGTVKLLASASVDLSRWEYIRSHVSQTIHTKSFKLIFWAFFLLFLGYFVWVAIYRVKHLRHLLAKREAQHLAKGKVPAKHAAAPAAPKAPQPKRPTIDYFKDIDEPVSKAPKAEVTPFPAAKPAEAPKPAPAPVPVKEETMTAEEKAERDYFEEFFKQK